MISGCDRRDEKHQVVAGGAPGQGPSGELLPQIACSSRLESWRLPSLAMYLEITEKACKVPVAIATGRSPGGERLRVMGLFSLIRCVVMGLDVSAAAVPGLVRSDLRGPGITRFKTREGFRYRDLSGTDVTDAATLLRIGAMAIPPAWTSVWISPDPLGHIQATGVDSRGRTQYRYHQLWREQRDAQKFAHMLRFASALPALRTTTLRDLKRRRLDRDRVVADAVRLIDLGLFRIGGEKYAELDHHYGATTLEKRHVRVTRDGLMFDYIAKEGKHRAVAITDEAVPVLPAVLPAAAEAEIAVAALLAASP
jgi:hypothetical protein